MAALGVALRAFSSCGKAGATPYLQYAGFSSQWLLCVGLSLAVARRGLLFICSTQASHRSGFSVRGTGSRARGLQELWLKDSSADSGVVVHRGPWHVGSPWLGIEPASPALQGRPLTTGPPGKPPLMVLIHITYYLAFSYTWIFLIVTDNLRPWVMLLY